MKHMSRGGNSAGEEKKLPEDSGAYSTHLHEIITSDMPHSIELCRDKVRIGSSNLDAHLTACMCFSSAGLSLDGAGDVGISLGTSDTVRLSESVAASSRFCSCSQYHGVTPWAV